MQNQIETVGMLLVKGVVLPVVGLFIAWASMMLPQWVRAKVKNESVAGVLERLSMLAFTVVTEIQQTVVSGLGDKANKEELAKARDRAIESLKTYLGPKGIKELMTVLGISTPEGLDKLITTYVESAVHNLKASKPKALEGAAIAVATATTTEETQP